MGQIRTSSAEDYVNFNDWSNDGLLKRVVWLNVLINFVPGVVSLVAFFVLRIIQVVLWCCGSRKKVQPDEEAAPTKEKKKQQGAQQEF